MAFTSAGPKHGLVVILSGAKDLTQSFSKALALVVRFAQDDTCATLTMTRAIRDGIRLGQHGGPKRKTLRAKVLGGSQKIFWETRKAL